MALVGIVLGPTGAACVVFATPSAGMAHHVQVSSDIASLVSRHWIGRSLLVMSDLAPQRSALLTNITILQLQTELLQRRLARRERLSEVDRAWLERALTTLLRTTREVATLIMDEEEASPAVSDRVLTWPRLLALPPVHNRN